MDISLVMMRETSVRAVPVKIKRLAEARLYSLESRNPDQKNFRFVVKGYEFSWTENGGMKYEGRKWNP
jgi:hypothetical protein